MILFRRRERRRENRSKKKRKSKRKNNDYRFPLIHGHVLLGNERVSRRSVLPTKAKIMPGFFCDPL